MLRLQLTEIENKITNISTNEDFNRVKRIHDITYQKEMTSVKERHLKKLTNLNKTTNLNDDTNVDKSKWIINLSSKQLSDQEKDLLAKGMNFCLTPTTVPKKEIIARVEDAIKNLPIEEADTVSAKVSLTLQATKTPKDNLSKQKCTTLKALKADKIYHHPPSQQKAEQR